jgi:hypothetical protein
LPEYRLPTEAEWNAAAADVGQKSIIFTRGRRNILQVVILVLEKTK